MRLFLAEKPSLARAIADALPGPKRRRDGYIECGSGDSSPGAPATFWSWPHPTPTTRHSGAGASSTCRSSRANGGWSPPLLIC